MPPAIAQSHDTVSPQQRVIRPHTSVGVRLTSPGGSSPGIGFEGRMVLHGQTGLSGSWQRVNYYFRRGNLMKEKQVRIYSCYEGFCFGCCFHCSI